MVTTSAARRGPSTATRGLLTSCFILPLHSSGPCAVLHGAIHGGATGPETVTPRGRDRSDNTAKALRERKPPHAALGRNMVAVANGAGSLVGCAAVHQTLDPDATRPQPERPVAPRRHAVTAPVFVDASGRRQRRVRRLGLLLAVPAAAYIALLLSALLGGPGASSPYLPLPESAERPSGGPASGAPQREGGDPRRPATAPTAVPEGRPGDASRTPASVAEPGAATTTGPSPAASTPPGAAKTTPAPAVVRGRSTASHPAPAPAHSTGRGRD